MPRSIHQDPTRFFSVVGAPYIRESHGERFIQERRTDDQRPRRLEIGFAMIAAGFCAVALGVSLFATDGAAKLLEVAQSVVK